MKFASTDLEKNFVNNHSSLDIQYLLSLKSEMIIATLSFGFFSSTQFIRDCWGTLIRRAAVDISLNNDSPLREDLIELLRMPVQDYSWWIPSIWFHVRSPLSVSVKYKPVKLITFSATAKRGSAPEKSSHMHWGWINYMSLKLMNAKDFRGSCMQQWAKIITREGIITLRHLKQM